MNNKILIVAAVACLSAGAVAQSTQSPSKSASGNKDRESSSPSVSEVTLTKPANGSKPVATGDVNGDGHADRAASRNSGHASESVNGAGRESSSPSVSEVVVTKPASGGSSNGARDVASGQVTGKRQHDPVTVQKRPDAASSSSKQ